MSSIVVAMLSLISIAVQWSFVWHLHYRWCMAHTPCIKDASIADLKMYRPILQIYFLQRDYTYNSDNFCIFLLHLSRQNDYCCCSNIIHRILRQIVNFYFERWYFSLSKCQIKQQERERKNKNIILSTYLSK